MENSYIKLYAKKRLVKNHFKFFLVSFLPYVTIVLLTVLNYYFYFFLRKTDFLFMPFISSYAIYVKASLFTISSVTSFILWKALQLFSDKYFISKNNKIKIKMGFRHIFTSLVVTVLKFFVSVAWASFYLSPCAVMSLTLYYAINYTDYGFDVLITLFTASVILFFIGIGFIYVTLKRYSMCNYVILTENEKDSLKIIEKSIIYSENKMVKYSLYCLSFIGWILSCIAIIPAFYVIPYIKMAKLNYFKTITQPTEEKAQKPVIFFLTRKIKVVGN